MGIPQARWYGSLLAGVLPFLLMGFLASAFANRLLFLGWGLAMALVYAVLLRHGWQRGWPRLALLAAAFGVFALGSAAFGALVARHGEALELGMRAFAPAVFAPFLVDPVTSFTAAAAWLVAAALAFFAAS